LPAATSAKSSGAADNRKNEPPSKCGGLAGETILLMGESLVGAGGEKKIFGVVIWYPLRKTRESKAVGRAAEKLQNGN